MAITFPSLMDCNEMASEWVGGFEYPEAFRQELRERFPEWEELHKEVARHDTVTPWILLDEYERRLASISMTDIVKSADDAELHKQLVERAKETLSVHEFVQGIKKRYFPEGVNAVIRSLMSKK